MDTYANNLAELARKVGVSRGTIYNFRRLQGHPKAQADGRHDIGKWKKFIASHANRIEIAGMPLSPIERARLELLAVKNQRDELRLAVERGDRLRREDVYRVVDTGDARARQAANRFFYNELPASSQGLPEKRIEKLIQNRLTQIVKLLPQPFAATV